MHNSKTMDSRPQVINVNDFCARASVDGPSETRDALRPLQGVGRWRRLQLLTTPGRKPPRQPPPLSLQATDDSNAAYALAIFAL